MPNVALRRVRLSTLAGEKQLVLYILSVCLSYCLSYPAPYCVTSALTCSAVPYFPYYAINGTIFFKKKEWCFDFSQQLLSEIFLTTRRIQRDIILNESKSSCKVPIILVYFNDTWISSTDFRKKFSSINISWKSVQWKPCFSMRMDRHDEANSRFSKFCERI